MKIKSSFIKKIIDCCRPSKKELLFMGMVFSSFLMIFVSGSFNAKTKVEQIASELSSSVLRDENASILCVSDNKSILSNERFSTYINDQFYEVNPFKSVIGYNFSKSVNCSIEELGDAGTNMSFLTSTYFTNHNIEERIVFDRYYFDLLFKETNTVRPEGISNFVYITKEQANYLIETNQDVDTYEQLINKNLTITIDDNPEAVWKIANIIDNDCLFCERAAKAFENYVVCFTLVPNQLQHTESMLLCMSESKYSNIDYITLIETNFDSKDYHFVSPTKEDVPSISKLVNYLNSKVSNNWQNILSIFMIIVFSASFIFLGYFAFKTPLTIKNIIEFVVSSLGIWLMFFVIYKITNSILFFSFVSLTTYFILFLSLLCLFFVIWLVRKYGKRNTII